tara:strand:+ start:240 stop:413 length:174 start_codon:yes stop_codon:yes gene_type:complete
MLGSIAVAPAGGVDNTFVDVGPTIGLVAILIVGVEVFIFNPGAGSKDMVVGVLLTDK